MKKYRFKIFGAALAIFFTFMLPFVSLLGENDRAKTTVQAYFDNITAKEFDKNRVLYSQRFNDTTSSISDGITEQFSLETALLDYFGIAPGSKYSIKAKRDRIWIPYLSDDQLLLSIQVIGHDESDSILKNYLKFGSGNYLEKLFTMIRENGRWKIDQIDIQQSKIAGKYNKALEVMGSSSFLVYQEGNLHMKEQDLALAEMDPIEKRILSFQLNKALTIVKQSKTN